jgi:succinate-acetate transporter protein
MEETMNNRAVCPYYGCDEEICDVGCGYISPHDAKMIIKFCSAQFCECQKFHELADRLGDRLPVAASAPPVWAAPVQAGAQPIAAPAFGLFCLGVTTALFALKQLPVTLEIHQLSLVMMAGALAQIIAGLTALRINPLRAVAFTALGLFWLSLLAVELLPSAGYGQLPGPLPQAGYFAMWGIFSLILAQGDQRLARVSRVMFSLLTAFLLLLALAYSTGSVSMRHSAALVGFACSLPGLACGMRQGWRECLRLVAPGRVQPQAQRAR